MNTSAIKKYAPKARTDFIATVTRQAGVYGITEADIAPNDIKGDFLLIGDKIFPASIANQRTQLIAQIQQKGFQQTMEAVAYGWFNRFIAIRYMELHDYLDHGRRVLSHPTQDNTFQILEECADIDLPRLDKAKIIELKLDGTQDELLYRELLLAQCRALHTAMPFLFEDLNSETELLLPNNLTQTDSLIHQLVNAIPEADWQQVEIVGWLYQFYIAEKKDQVIGKVVKSEDIPAATQLFTPNWIVKYMVQNSVGAQWLATYPDSPLKAKMEYYIEPAEQTEEVQQQLAATTPDSLNPETITIMDPACGSGHILVEAYELMREIYLERGYRQRDIPLKILQNNLFGLDIDDRAAQLSGFALMMKAREDDERIFSRLERKNISINVLSLQDSKQLDLDMVCDNLPLGDYGLDREIMSELIQTFEQAKTFGSLITIPQLLQEKLKSFQRLARHIPTKIFEKQSLIRLQPLIHQANLLAKLYDVVVANPPYMGRKGMNANLKAFAQSHFPDSKSDLFAIYIERCLDLGVNSAKLGLVTPYVWMFISSYEKVRSRVIDKHSLSSLIQLEYNAFAPACIPVCTFTINKQHISEYTGSYVRLSEFRGHDTQSPKTLEAIRDKNCGWFYVSKPDEFKKVPGYPIVYWASKVVLDIFSSNLSLSTKIETREGLTTGNNHKFLRLWHEVSQSGIGFDIKNNEEAKLTKKRWFKYVKGGKFRKWAGNYEYIVNWYDDGAELKLFSDPNTGRIRSHNYNGDYAFKTGFTWSGISSSNFSVRHVPSGFMFDAKGPMGFMFQDSDLNYCEALLNSTVTNYLLKMLAPTLDFKLGHILNLPVKKHYPKELAENTIKASLITLNDWNSFETSWEFLKIPLLDPRFIKATLRATYALAHSYWHQTTLKIQNLEKENNYIFINQYGLASELTNEVPLNEITLNLNPYFRYKKSIPQNDLDDFPIDPELEGKLQSDTLKELISYSIGCMMGRYSLNKEGLIYAHSGNKNFDASQYTTFPADDDGIIPLTDMEWFDDDATNRFKEFISVTWDKAHLDENLNFVADNLKPKRSEAALDTIRRYMSTGFYKDHLKTYKKRPIYWLFSSGKEKAFEALVYLHRYNEGTLARMRTEYVIPLSAKLNAYEEQLNKDIEASSSAAETKRLERQRSTLNKKQIELTSFDEKLRNYADQRIRLDLDDGVKVNYGKFGDLLSKVKEIHGKVVV